MNGYDLAFFGWDLIWKAFELQGLHITVIDGVIFYIVVLAQVV